MEHRRILFKLYLGTMHLWRNQLALKLEEEDGGQVFPFNVVWY